MATKVKGTMLDRLRRAFAAKDEAGFEESMAAVEEAVEANQEEQAKVELASIIAAAVAAGVKPLSDRLDAIETKAVAPAAAVATTKDDETPEEKAAREKAEKEAAQKAAAAAKKPETTDNDALAAFLKAKGLSDEDVAAACEMAAVATEDEDKPEPVMDEEGKEAEADEGEAKAKADKMTADAAGLSKEFRDTVARAEILAPGIGLPTYDGKATRKKTADTICALRRDALKKAFDSAEQKKHVAALVEGAKPDFSKMTCDAVRIIFAGASELAKASNSVRTSAHTGDHAARAEAQRKSIADMNKAHRDFWTKR